MGADAAYESKDKKISEKYGQISDNKKITKRDG